MRGIFRAIVILVPVAVVAACAPEAIIANRDQVVVEAWSPKAAANIAMRECERVGREAYFQREGRKTYWFQCRAPRPSLSNAPQSTRPAAMSPATMSPVAASTSGGSPVPTDRHGGRDGAPARSIAAKTADSMAEAAGPPEPEALPPAQGAPTLLTAKATPAAPAVARGSRSASGFWIQLIAMSSPGGARIMAARIQRAHPDLLAGMEISIRKSRNKRAGLYLARLGAVPKRAGADAICKELKRRQQDCFISRSK